MNRSLLTRCLSLLLALWLPATGFATSLQMIELSLGAGSVQAAHGGDYAGHSDHGHDHSSAGHDHDSSGSDADHLSHGQCTFCQVSVSLVAFEPLAPRDVHSSHVLIPRRAVLRLSADTDPPLRPPSPLSP